METTSEGISGAQPSVGTGETTEQVLEHLFELTPDNRQAALRRLAPLILPRLDDKDPDAFITDLRRVQMDRQALAVSEPADEPAETLEEVIEDVLEQPLGAQKRILEQAAPRIAAALSPAEREDFLRGLREAIDKVLAGEGTGETRH